MSFNRTFILLVVVAVLVVAVLTIQMGMATSTVVSSGGNAQSIERQEELKDQWLEQRGLSGPTTSTRQQRQEELKDQWLERRSH